MMLEGNFNSISNLAIIRWDFKEKTFFYVKSEIVTRRNATPWTDFREWFKPGHNEALVQNVERAITEAHKKGLKVEELTFEEYNALFTGDTPFVQTRTIAKLGSGPRQYMDPRIEAQRLAEKKFWEQF